MIRGAVALLLVAACASQEPSYRRYDDVDYGFSTRRVQGKRSQMGLAMAELGEGRQTPIILVHPWGLSMKVWSDVVGALGVDRRVVLLDLPGHGKSDKLPAAYPIDRLAAAILDVMDVAKIERGILIGNSMGGSAALAVALAAPRRVKGLVLIATPGGRKVPEPLRRAAAQLATPNELATLSDQAWATGMWLARARGTALGRSITDDLQRLRGAEDHRAWSRAVTACLHEVAEWAPPLAEIEAPALVVHGAWDLLVPRGSADALVAQLPRGQLVELEGCGHMPELECSAPLLAAIGPWLAALP